MEEIQSLAMERHVLEGVLNKLLMLSSRNVQTLGSVKDYTKFRRDLSTGKLPTVSSAHRGLVGYNMCFVARQDPLCFM